MMARKTKAEMNAQLTAENQAKWDKQREEWPSRVLDAVLTAAEMPNEFKVNRDHVGVHFECTDDEYTHKLGFYGTSVFLALPEKPDWTLLYDLEDFENAVKRHNKRVEEAMELARRRSTALNKLTKEERELLGL